MPFYNFSPFQSKSKCPFVIIQVADVLKADIGWARHGRHVIECLYLVVPFVSVCVCVCVGKDEVHMLCSEMLQDLLWASTFQGMSVPSILFIIYLVASMESVLSHILAVSVL